MLSRRINLKLFLKKTLFRWSILIFHSFSEFLYHKTEDSVFSAILVVLCGVRYTWTHLQSWSQHFGIFERFSAGFIRH